MTLHYTTNYGIAYADTDTALVDLAAVTQTVATSLDTALGRGGIAPPDATTQAELAARITSLEGSRTTDEGRLTTLEAVGAWQTLTPGTGFSVSSGGVCRYRVRQGRARLQAYLAGTWAANAQILNAALPTAARPVALPGATPSPLYRPGVGFGNAFLVFTIDAAGLVKVATAGTGTGFIFDAEWDVL